MPSPDAVYMFLEQNWREKRGRYIPIISYDENWEASIELPPFALEKEIPDEKTKGHNIVHKVAIPD